MISQVDKQYIELVQRVLEEGYVYQDQSRANIKMLEIPSYQMDLDMQDGFPLLTTKRIFWKTIVHELIWMLSGSTSIEYLKKNNVTIWDKDANNFSGGSFVGRMYGAQWRNWYVDGHTYLDQVQTVINNFIEDPFTRRHLVTAWNPAESDKMALMPCHWAFQIIGTANGFALKWMQRSCDIMLGLPFDIALYAFLGKLIERQTGIYFDRLIGDISCAHIYGPHISLIKNQITRAPLISDPKIDCTVRRGTTINNLSFEDFEINNYSSHSAIKAEMFSKV